MAGLHTNNATCPSIRVQSLSGNDVHTFYFGLKVFFVFFWKCITINTIRKACLIGNFTLRMRTQIP